jgi:protocatechuate 3,4-dioxygenase beta subunit
VKVPRPRSRREALAIIGAFGVVALAGCSSDQDTGSSVASTTRAPAGGANGSTGAPTSCVLSPELTQGPFFLADHPNTSNLVQDREGTLLALGLTVVGRSCAPIAGARVDIWHCDAAGAYAGVNGSGAPAGGPDGAATRANDQTWCQGYQDAGDDGRVRFTTIYPGWYPGRSVHIHVKVFAGGDAVHTGQLFFPDALSEALFADPPYQGAPDTTNEADSIFASGGAASVLAPTRRDNRYVAEAQLVVDA